MVKIRSNSTKKRGAGAPKSTKHGWKSQASKLSLSSRSVHKIVRAYPKTSKKISKPKNKMKYYTLKALTDFFEAKFNMEVTTEEDMTLQQMKFRNKYLFPAIKEGTVYKKDDLIFDENGARTYLECLANTLDKSSEFFMCEIPTLDLAQKTVNSNVNKDYNIVIKKSSSLSTESDA
jgi:hypothetical protein